MTPKSSLPAPEPAGRRSPRQSAAAEPVHDGLTAQQIAQCAELVANGKAEIPLDISEHDRSRMMTEIRRIHRNQIEGIIARAVARALTKERGRQE